MDPLRSLRSDDTHCHRHRAGVANDVQSEFLHGERGERGAGFDERGDPDLHGARGVVGAGLFVQSAADEG